MSATAVLALCVFAPPFEALFRFDAPPLGVLAVAVAVAVAVAGVTGGWAAPARGVTRAYRDRSVGDHPMS